MVLANPVREVHDVAAHRIHEVDVPLALEHDGAPHARSGALLARR